MRNLIKYFKTGSKLVPLYMVVLYLIFIGTDIFTTYIVTPDLKMETNWIIRYFHLNYTHMILLSYTYSCFGITSLFVSRGYLDHFLKENKQLSFSFRNLIFYKGKLFFSYVLLGAFYFHFFCSIYSTINNYLGYVYLFDCENPLINIAISYIESMHLGVPYYYIYSQSTVAIIGFIYTALKINRLASEVQIPVNGGLQISN
jgi:hypothetical protein